MAQGDTTICIVGNLTDDPSLRYTASGAAVASFRVASTPRVFDKNSNQWVDGDGLFLTCNVWREQAESVAESIQKGARVIVNGRLRQRSYETSEGENRTVYEVEVDDVGPSLKWATAKVTRLQREGGGQRYQGGQQGGYGGQGGGGRYQGGGGAPQGGYGQQGAPMDDPWGAPPQDEEAPF